MDKYEDYIDDEQFIRLPIEPVTDKFYRIKFTKKFDDWGDKNKIEWLEKVASSMNQWAGKLQKDNDELNKVLAEKEKLVEAMSAERGQDRQMIHLQLEEENKTKQMQAKRIKELMAENKKLKELINGRSDNQLGN